MRVENVKGAVWTVDEVEFYKRRPQRCSGYGRSPYDTSKFFYNFFHISLFLISLECVWRGVCFSTFLKTAWLFLMYFWWRQHAEPLSLQDWSERPYETKVASRVGRRVVRSAALFSGFHARLFNGFQSSLHRPIRFDLVFLNRMRFEPTFRCTSASCAMRTTSAHFGWWTMLSLSRGVICRGADLGSTEPLFVFKLSVRGFIPSVRHALVPVAFCQRNPKRQSLPLSHSLPQSLNIRGPPAIWRFSAELSSSRAIARWRQASNHCAVSLKNFIPKSAKICLILSKAVSIYSF